MKWAILKNVFSIRHLTSERSLNSLKTGIACFIGIVISKILPIPSSQWIVISIAVVMSGQTYLGGTVQKSYLRVLGTLVGAITAILTLWVFGTNTYYLTTVICLSAIVFSYVAGGSVNNATAGTLGLVTIVLVLINNKPSMTIAGLRALEITIGIIIALLVSRFVFPRHAIVRLKYHLGETLQELQRLYLQTTKALTTESPKVISHTLEDNILNAFLNQRKLLADAKSEHKKTIDRSILNHAMQHERRIYRAILILNYALRSNPNAATLIQALPEYQAFNRRISAKLQELMTSIKANCFSVNDLLTLGDLEMALPTLSESVTYEEKVSIDAFLVATRLLTEEINALIGVIKSLL